MNRNAWETGWDLANEHKDYIIGAGLVVGGGILMATGVGGPAGVMMIGAGTSAVMQKITTGEVNWKQAVFEGVISPISGGAGAGIVRKMAFEVGKELATGIVGRGLNGENIFDPRALGTDLLLGGVVMVPSGRLGARPPVRAASETTRALTNLGAGTRATNELLPDGHEARQGFSGVYDEASGSVLAAPSTDVLPRPEHWAPDGADIAW